MSKNIYVIPLLLYVFLLIYKIMSAMFAVYFVHWVNCFQGGGFNWEWSADTENLVYFLLS